MVPADTNTSRDSAASCTAEHLQATEEDILYAAELVRAGEVVAFPTETVYGLGADAACEKALARIFALKGRPADHPLIVHLADLCHVDRWARQIPDAALTLAERFWPGPLTLILRKRPQVPDLVTGSQDTIGIRIPSHPVARSLLAAFGSGIAAPSANRFGRISPTAAEHVRQELGNGPAMILNGGSCTVGLESTILDLSGRQPTLLRPGAITARSLEEVLGRPVALPDRATLTVRAPGMLRSHYAPQTPLHLVASDELAAVATGLLRRGVSVALATIREEPALDSPLCRHITMPAEPSAYGRELYATLRMLDRSAVGVILVEVPPDEPGWGAVRDRLTRAELKEGNRSPPSNAPPKENLS